MRSLLLHCCCAPCANQPIDLLLNEGWRPSLYFGNSNIQPEAEHQMRLEAMLGYAEGLGLPLYQEPYRRGDWYQAIGNDGGVFALTGDDADQEMLGRRRQRCRLCYRFRFAGLAAAAAELGQGAIASTLAISPYQFSDILADELQEAAAAHGLEALFVDWRPYYRQGQAAAARLGLYRQRYCGCEFSRQEALAERQAAAQAPASQGQGG
jgi:predicted adenine nucleotide alpha hydrolase (AANH) superfamily ATPase